MDIDVTGLLTAVMNFNQDRRLVRVSSVLDRDALMVHRVHGREEVSRPFDFSVDLLSPYANLELKSLIGQPLLLTLNTQAGTERYFHGYVREFARVGNEGGFARYEAKISPWFWFLSHRTNCRIYQDQNVVEIAEKIFREYGTLAHFHFAFDHSRYPKMPYCVQYNESDFAFVSRLLADAGIHYRFEHEEDKHTLVCSNDSTLCPPQQDEPKLRFHSEQGALNEPVMVEWTARRSVAAAAFSLKTFDFKQPRNPLLVNTDQLALPRGVLPALERYEYDGAAAFVDASLGDLRASVRMEEAAWRTKLYEGQGNARRLQAGCYFQLENHFEHANDEAEDRQFFTISVNHDMHNNFSKGFSDSEGSVYVGQVTCVRRKIPYRPERGQPPRMPGPQTATVVGPPGEELHADKFGRVKVQFHWDREGQSNEASSCYLRVASPWAGEGMGGVSIPRIGQEVVVDYLDGNPDRPLIVGRVYNAGNMPPFGLEVSGMRSKTVKGGGFNEMTMHDAPGAQLLNLQAERNMDTLVKNDQNNNISANKSTSVGSNHTENVGVDQTVSVGANQAFTVGANQDTTVKANRSATVLGNDTRTVVGTSDSTVTGAVTQTYQATQTRSVTGNFTDTVSGNWTSTLVGNYLGTVAANWADTVMGAAAWTVVGPVMETLNSGRLVSITGADSRQVLGAVDDSNVGTRSVSVEGTFEQGVSGTCTVHSAGDMGLVSDAKVMVGVGEASGITIDGSSVVITAGGSTIKIDSGGVTVNGSIISLNC